MRITRSLFIVSLACIGWACSGSAEAVKNAPATQNATPTPSSQKGNPNAETVDSAVSPTPGRIAAQPRGRTRVAPIPGPPPPLQFRKAAEDSEIATAMNAQGDVVETRIFKSHPRLERVEAVWKGAKEAEFKIFLKDGKIIDVKTGRIVNLQTASVRDLLAIAGIESSLRPVGRGAEKKPGLR